MELHFDRGLDGEYIQRNYDNFRNTIKEMVKLQALRGHVPTIKNAMNKA